MVPANDADSEARSLSSTRAATGTYASGKFLNLLAMPAQEETKLAASAQPAVAWRRKACQLAGNCNNVGIGSDLDGGFGTEQSPEGLESIFDLHKLEDILADRGYSAAEIDGVYFNNWLQFFLKNLPK